jgi:hypothetical protein
MVGLGGGTWVKTEIKLNSMRRSLVGRDLTGFQVCTNNDDDHLSFNSPPCSTTTTKNCVLTDRHSEQVEFKKKSEFLFLIKRINPIDPGESNAVK